MYTRTRQVSQPISQPRPQTETPSNTAVQASDSRPIRRDEPIRVRATLPPDYSGTSLLDSRFDDRMFSDTGENPFMPENTVVMSEEISGDYDFIDRDVENKDEITDMNAEMPNRQSDYNDRNENRSESTAERSFDDIYAPFLSDNMPEAEVSDENKPRSADYGEPMITRRVEVDYNNILDRAEAAERIGSDESEENGHERESGIGGESVIRGENALEDERAIRGENEIGNERIIRGENAIDGENISPERSDEEMPLNLPFNLPFIRGDVQDDELVLMALIVLMLLSGADDDLIIILAFLLMTG